MKKDFLLSKSKEKFTIGDNTFEIDDYTNILDISEILEQYKGELSEYQVSNDERIEVISFNIYRSSDYWDLLLLINEIKDFRKLPVNQDKLEKRLNEIYSEWLDTFGKNKTEAQKLEKHQELEQELFLENEKYRIIKYINIDKISEIKAMIKELVFQSKG